MEYSYNDCFSVLLILTPVSILDWFQLIYFLIMGHTFLLFCVLGNFLLDAEHCAFYLIRCQIFLYAYKYS